MITKLGKELRKVRLDHGITLYEMAQTIEVSSSLLSSVETGKKPATPALIDRLASHYPEVAVERAKFMALAEETKKEVTIRVAEASPKAKEFAMAFARKFESLDDKDFEDLFAVFNNKSKG